MTIRRAMEKDIPRVLDLLSQILELHAEIRPDLFQPGTVKYTRDDLLKILRDEEKPVYIAANEADHAVGYAFCVIREAVSQNMIPRKTFYLDDLCVDKAFRGQGIGEALFQHVLREAERLGCYNVVLNVWEGNSAKRFYEKMGLTPQKTAMEFIIK